MKIKKLIKRYRKTKRNYWHKRFKKIDDRVEILLNPIHGKWTEHIFINIGENVKC